LKFDEKPDYGFLKRLLKGISEREEFKIDFNYDWIDIKKEKVMIMKI
jgi:hypothetical protein